MKFILDTKDFSDCEFNNENRIAEIFAPQFKSNKWLYTLWIAETKIIDDLKENN